MWFFTPCRQILPLAALVREELSPFPTAFSISRHFRRSMDAHDPQETQQQENLATTDRRRNKSTKQGGIAPGKMCFSLSVVQTYHKRITKKKVLHCLSGNRLQHSFPGISAQFEEKLITLQLHYDTANLFHSQISLAKSNLREHLLTSLLDCQFCSANH